MAILLLNNMTAMKIIFRYMKMIAVAVFAAVACHVEEKVMVNPSDVIEPVLHDPGFPEVLTITPSNQSEEVCFTWDAADIGFGAQLNYAIEVSVIQEGEEGTAESAKASLGGGVSATSTTIKYEDINYAVVQSLGAEPEKEVKVNFYLKASLGVRPFYSAPLTVKVVPTNAPKMFPHIYFIGSYCTWNHTKSQLMYDHAENGLKYQGIIDLGEEWMSTTKGGFKLTPKADWSGEYAEPEAWDKDYADRLASGQLERNPKEVQFAAGGGDCKRYSSANRFYHFTLSMETYKFTMEKAFNSIALIWNGESMPLEFNKANFAQKFYADVTVGMDDSFHVQLDDVDNTCFGADDNGSHGLLRESKSGDAVKDIEVIVAPGKYRLYIDLNNWDALTYEFNSDMFEQEEGGASFGYKGWAICGFMNNWDGDLAMEQQEGEKACWWVARDVQLKKDYDFCFRKDGAGAIVLKGGGFKVNQPVWHYGGGGDIHITQTGTYDIWLNPTNGCCWVLTPGLEPTSGDSPVRPEGAADWSISGPLANGGEDIWMYETQYGYMAKDVELKNGDEFYFRYLYRDDHSVKTSAYAGMGPNTVGKTKSGTGSVMMKLETPGKYDIYLTTACDTIYVMNAGVKVETAVPNFTTEKPEGALWGLCGSFTNWEEDLWLTKEGGYYVAKGVALREMDALKFRKNGIWGDNGQNGYGVAATIKAGYYYPLAQYGGDLVVAQTGIYDIYMSENASRCYILAEGGSVEDAQAGASGIVDWTVAGDHNGWSGTRMVEEDGCYVAKGVKLNKGQRFQFKKGEWEAQKTADKTLYADMYYALIDGRSGNDIIVGETGIYDVYMSKDATFMYFMTAGTPRSTAVNGDNFVPEPQPMVTINVYGKTSHTHLYGWWEDGATITATWPGTDATETVMFDGVQYKKWVLSVPEEGYDSMTSQFIFNTPDKGQTSDSDAMTLTDGLVLIEKDGKAVAKSEILGPENLSEWVIVGDFIGDWGLSVNMYAEGDWFVARMVGIPAGSVFKFRKGTSWTVQKTYNGAVTANMRYSLGDAGYDDKASVAVAGVYDIYVAKDMSAMYFMEEGKTPGDASDNGSGSNTNPEIPDIPETPENPTAPEGPVGPWSVCGTFTNNWSSDYEMYESDGYYVALNVPIPAAAQFKFRKDRKWEEVRTYNGSVSVNTRYALENNPSGEANIVVPEAGTYDVYISLNADCFYLMRQGEKPGQN